MAKKPTILAKGPKTCTFVNFQTKPVENWTSRLFRGRNDWNLCKAYFSLQIGLKITNVYIFRQKISVDFELWGFLTEKNCWNQPTFLLKGLKLANLWIFRQSPVSNVNFQAFYGKKWFKLVKSLLFLSTGSKIGKCVHFQAKLNVNFELWDF